MDFPLFNIDGMEAFQISFVTKREKTLNDLKSIAGQHGFTIDIIGEADDGDVLSIISDTDEYSDIVGLLKLIRKQNDWVIDVENVNGNRLVMFYHREVFS